MLITEEKGRWKVMFHTIADGECFMVDYSEAETFYMKIHGGRFKDDVNAVNVKTGYVMYFNEDAMVVPVNAEVLVKW